MSATEKRRAKFVLRSLETSGQPPKWGAGLINVGTDQYLDFIRTEYLEDHLLPLEGMDGGGACKWIEADYGNGKTQFLRCVQEQAWNAKFLTAFVELSQDECPLDRLDRVFAAIVQAIQPPPQEIGDIDKSRGLDSTILQLVDRKFDGALSGVGENSELLRQWVEQLSSIPVDSTAITTAAAALICSAINGDDEQHQLAKMFLRGEALPVAELRKIGVHEKLDRTSGFRLLRSMCQFLQRSGLASGIVVLFDEARRSLSLMASKAQKTACENLLSIINKCNSGDLPGTLFLYAVMPEFFTDFATTYPALQQRCGPRTRIRLNELSGISENDLLVDIGKKIAAVFSDAYETAVAEDILLNNLQMLASTCIREKMGTGTRRQMVQSVVGMLKDSRMSGELVLLTEESAESLVDGKNQDWIKIGVEAVESEGE